MQKLFNYLFLATLFSTIGLLLAIALHLVFKSIFHYKKEIITRENFNLGGSLFLKDKQYEDKSTEIELEEIIKGTEESVGTQSKFIEIDEEQIFRKE